MGVSVNAKADAASATSKKGGGGAFSWILPSISALVLVKTMGMFAAIAAFVTYYVLKERIGIMLSLVASLLVAGGVFAATFYYFMPSSI